MQKFSGHSLRFLLAASGSHRFLELPKELRDMIYEFALTFPDGLFYQTDKKIFSTSQKSKKHFNRLKLVCRQFYEETRNMGLKNNELIFPFTPRSPLRASQLCIQFLDALPQKRLQSIRRITVMERPQPAPEIEGLMDLEAVLRLRTFCATHTRISIVIRLVRLSPASLTLQNFNYHGFLLMELNHKLGSLPDDFNDPTFRRDLQDEVDSIRGHSLFLTMNELELENFRFFPFHEALEDHHFAKDMDKDNPNFHAWLQRARNWHQTGF